VSDEPEHSAVRKREYRNVNAGGLNDYLKELYISPDDFTDAQAKELEEALSNVKVTRRRFR
jgi:hypothetical protein